MREYSPLPPRRDERLYIEADAYGDEAVWRVDESGDVAVLWRRDVKDVGLWNLICEVVSG